MSRLFASLPAVLAVLALAAAAAPALADPPSTEDNGSIPAGGKFRVCHGYVRHVSATNIKLHCIDGRAADLSLLYVPRYATLTGGKSVQTATLATETPVVVYYTQSLGIKKAYRIFVTDSNGRSVDDFRS